MYARLARLWAIDQSDRSGLLGFEDENKGRAPSEGTIGAIGQKDSAAAKLDLLEKLDAERVSSWIGAAIRKGRSDTSVRLTLDGSRDDLQLTRSDLNLLDRENSVGVEMTHGE